MVETMSVTKELEAQKLAVQFIDSGDNIVTAIIRPDKESDFRESPISFLLEDGVAVVTVNSNFADFNKLQRDTAMLYINISLDREVKPERIDLNFDTRIPPILLVELMTYMPHRGDTSR